MMEMETEKNFPLNAENVFQATPSENFHFQAIVSKVSSSHRIFVMSPEKRQILSTISIHMHTHTHSLS